MNARASLAMGWRDAEAESGSDGADARLQSFKATEIRFETDLHRRQSTVV